MRDYGQRLLKKLGQARDNALAMHLGHSKILEKLAIGNGRPLGKLQGKNSKLH